MRRSTRPTPTIFSRRVSTRALERCTCARSSTHTQRLVMVVQQEADQMERPPRGSRVDVSSALLDATYSQAEADGMQAVTLSQAAALATGFAGKPRAIAFPYIPSEARPEARTPWAYRGPYPATIDYHDTQGGMSFIEGRTTPVRVFPYARVS